MGATVRAVVVASVVATSSVAANANLPAKFDPAEYAKPNQCPSMFTFAAGKCEVTKTEVEKLDAAACKAAGFTPPADPAGGKCMVPTGFKSPAPECKAIAGRQASIVGSGDTARCNYESTIATSAVGDYISDCFEINAVPAGSEVQKNETYFVSGQRELDDDDTELTLVRGKVNWVPLGCRAKGGPVVKLRASQLIEAGASRYGYSFGFLTMPYKYFPKEKGFVVNAPIGGYLGWRAGQAGSGYTVAAALTLSSVKADIVDPNTLDANGKPTVTGEADVAALSGAVGIMFDILKSTRGKPFKAGVFVGQDLVSKDPTVHYKYNRKTWVAVQIGFDFTDN